jgi:hypothetical protein
MDAVVFVLALSDGRHIEEVDKDRLYRGLDHLLGHKVGRGAL